MSEKFGQRKAREGSGDYQGKYPVIFITFKDVKRDSWEETYNQISKILTQEFERHSELLESEQCSKYEKSYFENVLEEKADSTDMTMSLQRLSQMLDEHYGIPPIIIDEYDTPIQQGHMRGFYDKVILFMRNLFSGGLKDNRHLSYGFLTGILCVAKESIFNGLNNLKVNSILDNQYSEYFGFTPEEVKAIALYYHAEEKYAEICAWYDGYRFGDSEIFNPWSVINYFSNGCRPKAFWQSTGSNEIIGEILAHAGEEIYERLNALLQGESGEGRYDIQLLPKSEIMPGILIELKVARNFAGDKLKRLSETALEQIQNRKYDTDMLSKGVKTIFRYGVAFSGKQVEIAVASQ
ncbi:MAG: AAA family ATPase [Lachnospiraceae bacterium]|nr:AAA family ATPase [Lachnospiraceae bacterium]